MHRHYLRSSQNSLLVRLIRKLDHLARTREFDTLSISKQNHLMKRFKKLNRQLKPDLTRLKGQPALLGLLATAGVLGIAQQGQAQTTPTFAAPLTNPFALTDVGDEAKPTYVDIDNDGDLDLFAGNSIAEVTFFENIGTATLPAFDTAQASPFGIVPPTTSYITVNFQDMDNDGDFDLWIGDSGFDMIYYQNTGTVTAPAFAAGISNPFGLVAPYGAYEAKMSTGDLDGDGDYDLLVGGSYGNLHYFQNTGTATAPAFAPLVTNPFGMVAVPPSYAAPAIGDLDQDGDLDIGVGNNTGSFYFFENTGTSTAPAFALQVTNPFGIQPTTYYAGPAFADLDNDGDLDLTMGDGYGNFIYQEDTSGGIVPNLPPVLTLAATDSVCVNDTLIVGLIANDPEGDTLTLSATSSNQAVVLDANIQISGTAPNYQVTATPSTAGVTEIIVSVMDSANTVLDTLTLTVDACIPNAAPVVTGPANDSVCDGDTLVLPFMATDVNGDSLIFQALSNNQAVVMNSNISITGTAPNYTITIIPTGLGTTSIALIADDGAAQDTAFFDVLAEDCSVGLDASFFARRFEVYPNPAQGQLNYDLELFLPVEEMKLELVDLAGRPVHVETVEDPANEVHGSMDISAVSRGIYFLRVSTELYQFNRKVIVR